MLVQNPLPLMEKYKDRLIPYSVPVPQHVPVREITRTHEPTSHFKRLTFPCRAGVFLAALNL